MSDMPDVVHAEGDESYGAYYGSDQGDTTPYIRADLAPSWNRDMSAAPAGESVLLATTGGHVGEAIAPSLDDPDDRWFWSAAWLTELHPNHLPIAWMPLPKHPDDEADNG